MNQTQIAELFEQAARRPGLLVGRHLGQGNEFVIPNMALEAAGRVVAMAPEGPDRDVLIRKGEAGFRLLGEEMVRAAERIPNYPEDIVGEESRDIALAALGPFPPLW